MADWQRFRGRRPSEFELRVWTQNWPNANAGVVMGTPAGPDLAYLLIAVDVDATDADEVDAIVRALPASPMSKRGAKGLTLFYAASDTIRSRGYKVGERPKQRTLVDLLTGNQTRQTVVPPSVHPDGPTYVWVAGPVPASDLPVFDADAQAVLEETLETLGWGADAENRITRDHAEKRIDRDPDEPGTIWRDLNEHALADMAAWVPDLDLYDCQPVRRGGYEAVATWRDSNTGQETSKRKRNLKIHPTGIVDMGDRSYTALDLVQAARGCSLDEAFGWLNEKLGRAHQPMLPPQTADERAAEAEVLAEARATAQQEDEAIDDGPAMPSLNPPGLVGELTDYIANSGRRPDRVLALGAALTIVGTAAGRQFAGPTLTGTQLYVLPLARTGAGKDHPLKMIMRIMHAAKLGHHVGPSEFISMPAAIKFIGRSPLAVCPMDEFGAFLKRINNRRASGFEGAISGILRTAWGSSFQPMTTPEWAHVESRTIFAPCMSLYGASTPEEFYGALAAADTTNGLMNRFLVLQSRRRSPERNPTADPMHVPGYIVDALRAIYTAQGELLAAQLNVADQDRKPTVVPWADADSERLYADFGRQMEARIDADALEGAFLVRTAEMAQRLAVICAIGREAGAAKVTSADMAWGRDVALWSAETMIAGARDHMAENEHQAACNKVFGIIRESPGRVVSRGELSKKLKNAFNQSVLRDVLQSLLEAGRIEETKAQGDRGAPATLYKALVTI